MSNKILDTDKYTFMVVQEGRSVTTELSKVGVVSKKVFTIVGQTTVAAMTKHMSSLTESQCDQWFKGMK